MHLLYVTMSSNDVVLHISSFIILVMEYIPRGELFAFWKQYDLFSEDLVRIYAAELGMVLGKCLEYLESSKFKQVIYGPNL